MCDSPPHKRRRETPPPKTTTLLGKVPPQKRYVIIQRWKYNLDEEAYWSIPIYVEDCHTNPYAIEYLYTLIGEYNENTQNDYTTKSRIMCFRFDSEGLINGSYNRQFTQMYFSLCLHGKIKIRFQASPHPPFPTPSEVKYDELLDELIKLFKSHLEEKGAYIPQLIPVYRGCIPWIETKEDGFRMMKNETDRPEIPRFYSVVTTLNVGKDMIV